MAETHDHYRYCLISDYSQCWSGAYADSKSPTDKDLKIKTALAALSNYSWIAADLGGCDQVPETSEVRQDLSLWLVYYYKAFDELATTAETKANQLPNNDTSISKSDIASLRENLRFMKDMLTYAIPEVEKINIERKPNNTMKVPRAQPMELLAQCIIENVGAANIANLGHFKAAMSETFIVRQQHVCPDGYELYVSGLPKVLFLCLTHGNAKCSADFWRDGAEPHRRALLKARKERFRLEHEVEEDTTLFNAGRMIYARFDAIKKWQKEKGINLDKGLLTPAQYNQVVRWMYTNSEQELDVKAPGLELTFGCDHRNEVGRPFAGCGRKMMNEMSRCWKCRFLYHYNIPRPGDANTTGLIAEEPTQTDFTTNHGLACAEDLAHHRCWNWNYNLHPLAPTNPQVINLQSFPYPQIAN
ncbi:hypothetical protein DM02DRAFT_733221 [Periconia macrospinosa]|uniref:Uncharacterized protein n=1 Tax=Periconia macrospinosa TaxID=97972 RepID=A0A2V1D5K0_9PLEO|nr:hypothetical protein DM02DRAFT_733221 [Periconia macrospinosa]